ncbi:porin [Afipia sp. GAS231]|uniref:porin n=1 Tax=Afipia sp. GAS231 TaxID=1882747 RepID=UPI000879B085|nr:porin [Afipia sp. GAS231]SDM89607.1 Outer membrane protein (porin) [Afipia sp. GAS231]
MKRTLVLALAIASQVAAAHAADVDPFAVKSQFKDPLPDSLTWQGVTLFATLDLGAAYQTNGRPLGSVVSGLEYIPFTTTRNYTGQSISTITHSALEQSKIGVKIDEPLAFGWSAVGRADTGFDPLTGKLSDGCSSILQNAGLVYTQQNSNADSGRCGQAFNGVLYGGLSNKQYGTLTIGRQNSLQLDGIGAYDPMALSYAFSLLGYSGTNGGSGSTQAARWNNSAKYVYDFGPITAGAMYSNGGSNSGMFGNGYGLMVGGHYGGFSAQVNYTKEHGAVNLQSAVNDAVGSQTLAANISDNTTWSAMAKYTWQLGGSSPASYPTKARMAETPSDKFSIFAGYTHVDQANPSSPVLFGDAAGGYVLTSSATLPDNDAFTTDKVLQFFWAGAKYEWAWGLSVTGAYYHVNQNSYVADGAPCVAGGASKTDCSGNYDQVSLLADYVLSKHFDVYAGATYARVTNGLASGFPGTPGAKFGFAGTGTSVDTASFVTGFRVKI